MSKPAPELVRLLQEVSGEVRFPETPPLATSVRARIEAGPIPVAEIELPRSSRPLWRPVLVTLSIVFVALAVTLAVSVTARRAVADLLGVVGIRITFDEHPGISAPGSPSLDLGERVSVAEASLRVGFDVVLPARRGTPSVYYDPDLGSSGMVSVVYPGDTESIDEVELLVTQFVGTVDGPFFKKLAVDGADVTYVRVAETDGYWVGGEHLFLYVDSEGRPRDETVRLAGRVLIWQADGITYRIEGAPSLKAALRVAANLR